MSHEQELSLLDERIQREHEFTRRMFLNGITLAALAVFLRSSEGVAPHEIQLALGSFLITPSSLTFRTSPFSTQGDARRTDNIVEQRLIVVGPDQTRFLNDVTQFHLNNPQIVVGSDALWDGSKVVMDSPFWLKIPRVSVTTGSFGIFRTERKQDLYLSWSSLTQADIVPLTTVSPQMVKEGRNGYYLGRRLVVRKNELGTISDVVYKKR